MKTMKTSELTGAALDWARAKAIEDLRTAKYMIEHTTYRKDGFRIRNEALQYLRSYPIKKKLPKAPTDPYWAHKNLVWKDLNFRLKTAVRVKKAKDRLAAYQPTGNNLVDTVAKCKIVWGAACV